jgi:GH24 family phage-related lysozyme (muramidase)
MTTTGMGFQNPLFFIGVIENNVDLRLEGRVQVRAFGIHGTRDDISTSDLPWATLIVSDTNFVVPPLNSWVFGLFLDGRDAQQPFILGIIPTQMTQIINPEVTGWGVIPNNDFDRLGQGSRPEDYGQPLNSKLARGEYTEETSVMAQAATRITNIPIAGEINTNWSEPEPAYNAQYPFNRVTETAAGHSVELDDTPGSERIRVYHTTGSFVEIDSRGSMNIKTVGDRYDINERNSHTYVGGKNILTIEGDHRVLVKGNKIEEVYGDYRQVIHGNHEVTVAGQMNFNASDEIQARAAKITLESNIENFSIRSAKAVNVFSGESLSLKSQKDMFIETTENLNLKSGENIFGETGENIDLKSSADVKLESAGGEFNVKSSGGLKLNSSGKLSLLSGNVIAIDGAQIQLANDLSEEASGASGASGAAEAISVDLQEPTFKSIPPTKSDITPTIGMVGYSSQDDIDDTTKEFTSNCSTNIVEYLKIKEGFSEKAYWDVKQYTIGYGTKTDNPNEIITREEAEARLTQRVAIDREYIKNFGKEKGYDWNDCQVDSLTSFAFNLGRGSINQVTAGGTRSNEQIKESMKLYDKAGGKALSALTTRRKFESDWFNSGGNTNG